MIVVSLLLFCMAGLHGVRADPRLAQVRRHPDDFPITKAHIEKRSLGPTTCGSSSDVTRAAQEGWQCVVDTRDGLWGFCPTTITRIEDCPMGRNCIDSFKCTAGCGRTDFKAFTCEGDGIDHCRSALLVAGPQTYSYLDCAAGDQVEVYTAASEFITRSDTITTPITSPLIATVTATPTPTSTSPVPSSPPTNTTSSSNVGAIAGGVVGGLAAVAVGVGMLFFWKRKHQKTLVPSDDLPEYSSGLTKYAHVPEPLNQHSPIELSASSPGPDQLHEMPTSPTGAIGELNVHTSERDP